MPVGQAAFTAIVWLAVGAVALTFLYELYALVRDRDGRSDPTG